MSHSTKKERKGLTSIRHIVSTIIHIHSRLSLFFFGRRTYWPLALLFLNKDNIYIYTLLLTPAGYIQTSEMYILCGRGRFVYERAASDRQGISSRRAAVHLNAARVRMILNDLRARRTWLVSCYHSRWSCSPILFVISFFFCVRYTR
jgi:hypothetical protein